MSAPRHLGEIPGLRVFKRTIRPFHAALALSTGTLGLIQFADTTLLSLTTEGDIIGVAALLSSALLTWGWWRRSNRSAEVGLALAAGVWAHRAALVLTTGSSLVGGPVFSAMFSLAWVVGAIGAWAMERYERVWSVHAVDAEEVGREPGT